MPHLKITPDRKKSPISSVLTKNIKQTMEQINSN